MSDKGKKRPLDLYASDSDEDEMVSIFSSRPMPMAARAGPSASQKRQRLEVPLNEFVKANLVTELTQLGENISLVADANRDPRGSETFQQIQGELNDALTRAFRNAQENMAIREQQRQSGEEMGMGEAEQDQHQLRRRQFFMDLEPITQRMTAELTHGEQARIFKIIIDGLNNKLNNVDEPIFAPAPPVPRPVPVPRDELAIIMDRVDELSSIAYNWALTQLSVTLTNIFQQGPRVIRQTIALIAGAGMLYNYLPEGTRQQFIAIPYLGPLFTLMNGVNPQALLIQNSAATVTTVYYMLRNAGIETGDAIGSLGAMATAAAANCSRATGRYVCSAASSSLRTLRDAANNVVDIIANRLGDILTNEYQNQEFLNYSQDTQVSQDSAISVRTVDVNSIGSNVSSQISIASVVDLLYAPVADGGVDIDPIANPPEIVEERLLAIVQGAPLNPIIAEPVQEADADDVIAVAQVVGVAAVAQQPDSQFSDISDVSNNSEAHWSVWLFGRDSSGGRRLKKSRRYLKGRKTRKGRRRQIKHKKRTMKGRKNHRTLKRYRSKMRR
jgi:hypothetical protein